MAKVNKDALTRGFSGKLGRTLVFRRVGDQTIVQTAPLRRKKWSEAQQQQRDRFTEAIGYARMQMKNPVMKEAYTLAARGTKNLTAYNMALTDFLRAPEITRIDCREYSGQPGNCIRIRATDDFGVAALHVKILAADGTILESGPATMQPNRLEWVYYTTVQNPAISESRIVVKARDLPGNETAVEQGFQEWR